MVILLAGASHTGKTYLAQRLMEKYHIPYMSIDHLKMGLIRSGVTELTPMEDDKLTDYLWPIVREMIKTVVENQQNLIIEGCYIPFDWEQDFDSEYLKHIRYLCLIMSKQYIESHFDNIKAFGSVIEKRLDDSDLRKEALIADNENNLLQCKAANLKYLLIDESYEIDINAIAM